MLRPHCEKTTQQCPEFAVENPLTLKTPVLSEGSLLDLDVVLKNPNGYALDAVRSWLSYDPQVLEGQSVQLGTVFPLPVPGESGFAPSQGYVQIGQAAAKGKEPRDTLIVVARVTFKVKHVPEGGKSAISFYDLTTATSGHTVVVRDVLGQKQNVLPEKLGSLLVLMKTGGVSSAAQSAQVSAASTSASSAAPIVSSATSQTSSLATIASSSSSVAASVEASASSSEPERTAFVLLQVQNVRVGTEGTSLFIAWDALQSSELQGYNIYYGTEAGRYIQRKSVAGTVTSLTIRALPLDTTYYVGIRAVNRANEESAFSQEVSVKIGNAKTSTAPLTVGSSGPEGKNPLEGGTTGTNEVPGASGPSSIFFLFILGSAAIGTACALRRQLRLPHA
jgi:hypothetical protein